MMAKELRHVLMGQFIFSLFKPNEINAIILSLCGN